MANKNLDATTFKPTFKKFTKKKKKVERFNPLWKNSPFGFCFNFPHDDFTCTWTPNKRKGGLIKQKNDRSFLCLNCPLASLPVILLSGVQRQGQRRVQLTTCLVLESSLEIQRQVKADTYL